MSKTELEKIIPLFNKMAKTRNLKPLLLIVLAEVTKLIGAEKGYVILVEPYSEDSYEIHSKVNQDSHNLLEDTISKSILFSTIRENRLIVVQNAMADPNFADARSVVSLQLRSVLCAPLIDKDRSIGAIYLENSSRKNKFDEDSQNLIELFATQASISIINARLNEEMIDVNQQLEILNEQKSKLIHIIAHELRTPLANMKLLLSLFHITGLKKYISRLDSVFNEMHHNVEMTVLASQLLSGSISIHKEEFLLGELIRAINDELAIPIQERKQEFELDIPEQLPTMFGDKNKLFLAFLNVLSNAIKFTPNGGQITFTVYQNSNDTIQFAIYDTGVGIPVEEQERVFELFHVLGNVMNHSSGRFTYLSQGLGIGLPLAKGIIEAHGGQIHLQSRAEGSEQHQGTSCIIQVPLR